VRSKGPFAPASLIALALLVVAIPLAADPDLPGKTYDYEWDGRDVGHRELAWLGRAYVPPEAAEAGGKLPLVVFLHGLNSALIKYRWMGGGNEGDVRRIIGDMVKAKAIPPVVVAGPSSIVASEVSGSSSWNRFDLDNFLDRTIARLDGVATIDEERIIVAGHSGAGCSTTGGLATVGKSRRRLHAIVSIDTCMMTELAAILAQSHERTHVVVGYQTVTWTKRPFDRFRKVFERETQAHPAAAGVLREIDLQKPKDAPHDATVAITFHAWLPALLGPGEP
jgi:hypothetical protein